MSPITIRLEIVNKANAILPVPIGIDAVGRIEEQYLRREEKRSVTFAGDSFWAVVNNPKGYEALLQQGFVAIHLRRDLNAYDPAAIPEVLSFLRTHYHPIYVEILKNDSSLERLATDNAPVGVAGSAPQFLGQITKSVIVVGQLNGDAFAGDSVRGSQAKEPDSIISANLRTAEADERPSFDTESELRSHLLEWIQLRWDSKATGGTGRSGNVLIKCVWRGNDAFLKISADAKGLRSEAASLAELRAQGIRLSIAKVFAHADVPSGDDNWMGYLMEPVGKMSLRDYLFDSAPSPSKYLGNLAGGLEALYSKTMKPSSHDFIKDYLVSINYSLKKIRDFATFHGMDACFENEITINRALFDGPSNVATKLLTQMKQDGAILHAMNPTCDCNIHGDLHFENIRVNPADYAEGTYWLIDPKGIGRGDYVYDIAKLMTSLTGHAHADVAEQGRGNPRMEWTKASNGGISFNCILESSRQADGWRLAIDEVGALASRLAPQLEGLGGVQSMKRRLLLVLARHYFSALRYFVKPEAQWLLFGRGVQFLNMFCVSLDGKAEQEWDPFIVCASDIWLETR